MFTTVSLYDFRESFRTYNRMENFTYEGLEVLFDYLESYEDDTGEKIELDVIALCCDYTEDTPENIASNYPIDLNDADIEDEDYADQCKAIILDYLNDKTTVVGETDNTIIYQVF